MPEHETDHPEYESDERENEAGERDEYETDELEPETEERLPDGVPYMEPEPEEEPEAEAEAELAEDEFEPETEPEAETELEAETITVTATATAPAPGPRPKYSAEISRDNPSFFLFLVDQSSSMADDFRAGDATQPKASGVADGINRWMQELSIKCAKAEGVRDYYNVGVIGYGNTVSPAFVGTIAGRDLVPISEIAENPARLEQRTKKVPDGAGGIIEQTVRVPVWLDPVANGATPMCRAASEAYRILEEWLDEHPDCFPPIVIHITDGEATDGMPLERIRALTNMQSTDGNVLLFNIHLSGHADADPISFPDSPDVLPDDYSKMLYETASSLTPMMAALAREHGFKVTDQSKAFVLNADLVLLVQAIDIGTRPSNLR
jgi:hypothetical protein